MRNSLLRLFLYLSASGVLSTTTEAVHDWQRYLWVGTSRHLVEEPQPLLKDQPIKVPRHRFISKTGEFDPPHTPTRSKESDFLERSGFDGGAEFAIKLYKEIIHEHPSSNIVVSPFSAYLALLMASYGAHGNTEDQIVKILHRPHPEVMQNVFPKVLSLLKELSGVELNIANNVYVSKDDVLLEKFSRTIQSMFQSNTVELDTSNPQQASFNINNWIEQLTRHKIRNIIDPSDIKDGALFLINAIYFKSTWRYEFQRDLISSKPFMCSKGVKSVPMMLLERQDLEIGDLPEVDAKFVVLPYSAPNLEMIVVVPNQIDGLSKIENNILTIDTKTLGSRRNSTLVILEIPKFKIESKLELNKALMTLGMVDAFTTTADFSGISQAGLKIGKVIQKAFIEISEKGAETFPVSGIEDLREPKFIKVDRPSYFLINYKNINLFSGRLCDPSA